MADALIHNDHLGTPQKLTDSTGTVVWAADYKPFGETTVTVSTITNNLRFPGQYDDQETNLHYNYFRDYNPSLGRYVESDPIGIKKGLNHLYSYVSNRPLNITDRLGLDFGTTDCSYYSTRCEQTGDFYYCYTVKVACNTIHIPFTNWDQCVRQCLQEYDFYNKACSDKPKDYKWKDFTSGHSYCFSKCWQDSNTDPVPPPK